MFCHYCGMPTENDNLICKECLEQGKLHPDKPAGFYKRTWVKKTPIPLFTINK